MAAALLLLALVAGLPCRGAGDTPAQLPRDTEPYFYQLELWPDYGYNEFTGNVVIWINANRDTANVTLHARDLRIDQVSVTEADAGTRVKVKSWTTTPDTERLVITADRSLVADRRYRVWIRFHGRLRTDMTGFYRSRYTEFGVTKYVKPRDRALGFFGQPTHFVLSASSLHRYFGTKWNLVFRISDFVLFLENSFSFGEPTARSPPQTFSYRFQYFYNHFISFEI